MSSLERTGAPVERIALIGFGEVGRRLAADLTIRRAALEVVAWDRLFVHADSAPSRAAQAMADSLRMAASLGEALLERTLVISAVTASECLAVAREAAARFPSGAWFLDLNSVSPATRMSAAALIDGAGGRYVEGAVMSPIAPRGLASPMLLGGPHAGAFATRAAGLGLAGAQPMSATIGRASAAKMCRSVMIKGLEALLTESLTAARAYGVEATVLESLRDLLPIGDWEGLAGYMIGRSLVHGRRRAEEMREVVRTVSETGLQPWMSEACAARQDWAADLSLAADGQPLGELLDAVLERVAVPPGSLP